MTYEEFKTDLMATLKEDLKDLEGVTLRYDTIDVSFGESDRLVVGREGTGIAMSFKLKNMFDGIESGDVDFLDVERGAINTIVGNFDELSAKERRVKDLVHDFDTAKDYLLLRMIPGNSPILEDTPHEMMGDMAVVVSILFDEFSDKNSKSSAIVNNGMMREMGVTSDQLFEHAKINGSRLDPITIKPITTYLGDMVDSNEIDYDQMLYVVSVESGIHGAAAIAYPEFHDQVTSQIKGNFYVIPSSVSEVLLISDKAKSAKEIDVMIHEINEMTVRPEERLSEHCLHYDSRARQFTVGTEHDDKVMQQQKKKGGSLR